MGRPRTIGANGKGAMLAQAWISRADHSALEALAVRMRTSRSEIVRTGIKVMLARAREQGLLPVVSESKNNEN